MYQKHSKQILEQFAISSQIHCEGRTILSVGQYLDQSKSNPQNIIVKECIHSLVGNNCSSACSQLRNEYQVASQFNHPHITTPIETQQLYKGGCMVVLPKAECDAFDFFTKQIVSVEVLQNYLRSIASALSYVHNKGIAHNDVKLENVLCFKNENNDICFKLSDFGFSYSVNNESNPDRTSEWRNRQTSLFSPKINSLIMSKQFTEQCEMEGDVFSFGYSLFMILFRRTFCLGQESTSQSQLYQNLMKFKKSFILAKLKSCVQMSQESYEQCLDLLLSMIVEDDKKRITAEYILNHPFLQ